ncbi:MAG: type VI secretion system baseplate subunit TssG, partial [Planctomycetota bacterium]
LPPPDEDGGGDLTSDRLLALVGIDRTLEDPRKGMERPWVLLAVGGLAALQPRSAVSLEGILKTVFPHLNPKVEQFVGRWSEVPRGERNHLAEANCRLGVDVTLGERVFSYVNTFRVHVGPVYDEVFLSLGPKGKMIRRLRAVIDLFNHDCLDYEIEVMIFPEGMPEPQLGSQLPRLGWSTWIGRKPENPKKVTFLVKGWPHG